MWKSTDGVNYVADGIPSLHSLIDGLFDQKTLLNILKNYIYFPDTSDKELMVVPKYSQYYASELLFENIKKHLKPASNGKGGTYFGATGCGKSYTMAIWRSRVTTKNSFSTASGLRSNRGNPSICTLMRWEKKTSPKTFGSFLLTLVARPITATKSTQRPSKC